MSASGRAKAVFLDRDGTINKEVNNLRDIKDLRLLPGAADAIREIRRLGYLTIVVTNQPVIAKGWIDHDYLNDIHDELLKRLSRKGAGIDAIYYCPHHPDANLKKYRKRCKCRKPNSGMLENAMEDFNVDPKRSFMIGDSMRDVQAGHKAGVRTILLGTGYDDANNTHGGVSDFNARSLRGALKIIEKYGR